MGRRKRTAEFIHPPRAEFAHTDCAAQKDSAGSAAAGNTPKAAWQSAQRHHSATVGRHSPKRLWLLLAAIVLEAAWLCLLLVMVLRRW